MKKRHLFLSLILLFSLKALGSSLDAHVHGYVNLDIAVDKKELLIMLKTPAESFLGFEYKAKTLKEKQKLEEVRKSWLKDLKVNLGEVALKNCTQKDSKWKQVFMGENHSQIEAEAYFSCKKLLSGKTLLISFKRDYKRIQKINLQVILDNGKIIAKEFSDDIIKIQI